MSEIPRDFIPRERVVLEEAETGRPRPGLAYDPAHKIIDAPLYPNRAVVKPAARFFVGREAVRRARAAARELGIEALLQDITRQGAIFLLGEDFGNEPIVALGREMSITGNLYAVRATEV